MNCRDTTNRTTDIALAGGAIVAKLFGVINPCAATVGVIVDSIKERRSRKFSKRLESLIQSETVAAIQSFFDVFGILKPISNIET